MEDNGVAVFEARLQAEAGYMDTLQQRSTCSVWLAGGCTSWYIAHRSGRLPMIWADYAYSLSDENRHFHPQGYQ